MSDADAFLRMLSDAESALAGSEDDQRWASDIPIPLMREMVADSDEVAALLEQDDAVAVRWAIVDDRPVLA